MVFARVPFLPDYMSKPSELPLDDLQQCVLLPSVLCNSPVCLAVFSRKMCVLWETNGLFVIALNVLALRGMSDGSHIEQIENCVFWCFV